MGNQIYIIAAKDDRHHAKRLYDDLKNTGLDVWMESEDLDAGENPDVIVRKNIRSSACIIAILSSNAFSKRGFANKELKIALDEFDNCPVDSIFLIPVRTDDCEIYEPRLESLRAVDLFSSYQDGLKQILKSIGKQGILKPKISEPDKPVKKNDRNLENKVSEIETFYENEKQRKKMTRDEVRRFVRETYPFPIALAYNKTLGLLDDNMEKLKNIFETAEVTVQFLALLVLAQVKKDLAQGKAPDKESLKQAIRLNQTSFGTWHNILREVMKSYYGLKSQLIVPELFDFCFSETSDNKLSLKPIHNKALVPIRNLRNDFHHGRLPDSVIKKSISDGLEWLHLFLEEVQFLSEYKVSFNRQTLVKNSDNMKMTYIHDLTVFNGCLSDTLRWESEIVLKQDAVIFLNPKTHNYLSLSPFMILTDQVKGINDIFLINNVKGQDPVYVSCQFHEEITTTNKKWTEGSRYKDAVADFLDKMDLLKTTPDNIEVEDQPVLVSIEKNEKQGTEKSENKDVLNPEISEQEKPVKKIDSDLANKVSEIEDHIENAEYKEAYRKFKTLCSSYPAYKNQAISFLARFNELSNKINGGGVSEEAQTTLKHKIGYDFLECLNRFKERHL